MPYNCPIDSHVSRLGKVKHREFAMAAGEMSREKFTTFLAKAIRRLADSCVDGATVIIRCRLRG